MQTWSDESDSGFLAETCPEVTRGGSFHQGLGVKGRRGGWGGVEGRLVQRGSGHDRCMLHTQTSQFTSFY